MGVTIGTMAMYLVLTYVSPDTYIYQYSYLDGSTRITRSLVSLYLLLYLPATKHTGQQMYYPPSGTDVVIKIKQTQ